MDSDVPKLGIKIKPHILEDCPNVLSMGIRCAEEGFGFYRGPFSYKPRLVRPDGTTISGTYEKGGVPMVPAFLEETDDHESVGDTGVSQGSATSEEEADEELFDCIDVAFPNLSRKMGAPFCDEKCNVHCKRFGLEAGFAPDLRTGWGLSKREEKREAVALVRTEKPALIIAWPNCGHFSSMSDINPETLVKLLKHAEAVMCLWFVLKILLIQIFINR